MKRRRGWLVWGIGCLLIGAGWLGASPARAQAPASGAPIFERVTERAGIRAAHHEVYMITGQAWGDVNNDGWLDLYLTDSDGPNSLYLNQGFGSFAPAPYAARLTLADRRSGGAVFADYDNDGWTDLYVVNWGPNTLFRNVEGRGFLDVTDFAGVGDNQAGKSAAWGDYDADGYLDLYVANWSCTPECGRPFEGDRDRLYHKNGDGTIPDVTDLLGPHARGAGFALIFLDYDNDGDADIYLVNDEFMNPVGNKLWRNDGPGCDGWCFTQVATEAGADTRVMGMGLASGDYDNDGDLDLFFTNAGVVVLLRNQGDGTFADVAGPAGVALDATAISWGAAFLDFNRDGWQDLYVGLTEHRSAGGAHNPLFQNMGDGTFREVVNSGAADPGATMGLATADFDNDGWVDLVVGNAGDGYELYRNLGSAGTAHNWLALVLRGVHPVNRDAIGARVIVETTDGRRQIQEVASGGSLGAGNALTLHVGLGTAILDEVTVVWPNGLRQRVPDLSENRRYLLEYAGRPIWLDAPAVAAPAAVPASEAPSPPASRWSIALLGLSLVLNGVLLLAFFRRALAP